MVHRKHLLDVVGGTVLALAAGGGGAMAQDSGVWNSKAVLVAIGTKSVTLEDQKDHTISITEYDGVAFNADGKPFLDKARYQVTNVTDTGGLANGGYKIFTDPDGSKVFAKYVLTEAKMDAKQPELNGRWEFTGGTGKYKGISGRGTYHVVVVSDTALWDELTGEYKLAPQ